MHKTVWGTVEEGERGKGVSSQSAEFCRGRTSETGGRYDEGAGWAA